MITLKLTKTQIEKLNKVLHEENVTRDNLQIVQQQHNTAVRARIDIFDMVLEAHNVEKSSIDEAGKITLKDGVLQLPEKNASARIKKTVRTNQRR